MNRLSEPVMVRLDHETVVKARWETNYRRNMAIRDRMQNHNRTRMSTERMYEIEYIGAIGEAAVSVWTGLPWTGSYRGPFDPNIRDVDPYEVKTSERLRDLWIRGTTVDTRLSDQIYIRALYKDYRTVELVGWSSLGMIVDYGHWSAAHDCWIYDADRLQPMETLP